MFQTPDHLPGTPSSTVSGSSPKKFSNQGLVYLSEIETESDLGDLSVKQMKDILAMNRVAFKGVVEKAELHKLILRLWKQEMKQLEGEGSYF